MLKQALNGIFIEGILAENNLEYGSFTKNGKTVDSISGKIIVKVVQPIDGVDKELMIPVNMFAAKYKNDGNPNPAYTSIETVMNDYVSIAASDEATADRVRISNASIEMNEYYPAPDKLVSIPRIKASFVNRIAKDTCKMKAEGQVEFYLAEKTEEINNNDEPTGRVILRGVLPQYGGRVDVVPFIASAPGVVDVVNNYWNEGDTVKAKIKLNFSSTVKEIVEESDFGESTVKSFTVNVSEIIIVGGMQNPYDEENAFSTADIQNGLVERKARLEAQKAKDISKSKSKAAPTATANKPVDLGF